MAGLLCSPRCSGAGNIVRLCGAVGCGGLGHLIHFRTFADEQHADFTLFAGNNYSISNESRTKSARIFFAQGCEVEAELASQE